MKGLIYKDMLLMRSKWRFLIITSFLCVFVGILFIISSKCGNIARLSESMAPSLKTEADIMIASSLPNYIYYLILFLPMAASEAISTCFGSDSDSSFSKVFHSVPLSPAKKVGSRFISVILCLCVGLAASTISAVTVGILSDSYTVTKLLFVVLYCFCITLSFFSAVTMLDYINGGKSTEKNFIIVSLVLAACFAAALIILTDKHYTVEMFLKLIQKAKENAAVIRALFVCAAAAVTAVSYFVSVKAVRRKTGRL